MAISPYLLAFSLTLLFVYFIRKYANKIGLMDIPNQRSHHKTSIARGGGIGFIIAFFMTVFIYHFNLFYDYIYLFLSILLIFFMGLIDDLREVNPLSKFAIIFISTLIIYFNGFRIEDVGLYLNSNLSLGYFTFIFTFFAVSGFTNALNLIDGLDGLSSFLSIIILLGLYIIGYMHNDNFIMVISMTLICVLGGFLLFNWHKASIFMGDSGSLTLGFIISILSIKALEYIPAVNILFLGAIPILDTMIVMIRRKLNGFSSFRADRWHIHHIVLRYFDNNVIKSVLFLSLMQIIYTVIGVSLSSKLDGIYILPIFIFHAVILYHILSYFLKDNK